MSAPSPPSPRAWTAAQRGVLIGLALVLAACIAIRAFLNPAFVSDPQPLVPPRASELADRLDPNTVTAEELAALPMIGERRARDIIAFRDRFISEHPGKLAFEEPNDLMAIRGIGPAILQLIRPFLIFPKNQSTSGPS